MRNSFPVSPAAGLPKKTFSHRAFSHRNNPAPSASRYGRISKYQFSEPPIFENCLIVAT
jgi:hypothetical protein